MRRLLLLVAFLAFCAVPAFAQDSEFSGGGGGGVSTAPGSGNAGRVPQFASATSVVDSKMLTSGTNSGTWTLYDSTAVTGVTQLALREGPGQSTTNIIEAARIDGTVGFKVSYDGGPVATVYAYSFRTIADTAMYDYTGVRLSSTGLIRWTDGANWVATYDTGLARAALGILAVTDGSTGQGGIGISDAATATVTDALILRHATTDAGFGQDGFGTGLLFQGENSVGTMHDAASIDAVFVDSADGSEDSDLVFRSYESGVETLMLTMRAVASETYLIAPSNLHMSSVGLVQMDSSNAIHLMIAADSKWMVNSTGHFLPNYDITNDIGTPTKRVKDSYLGTSIQGTRTQAISAEGGGGTEFVEIAVASGASVGGFIEYTVQADDGTDREIESGIVSFTATNEAGTEAANVSILGTPAETPGAALTVSFDVTTGLTNVFRVKVISDSPALVPTTHKIEYRVHVNSGTTTVTPLT